jgi:hypothetical protein
MAEFSGGGAPLSSAAVRWRRILGSAAAVAALLATPGVTVARAPAHPIATSVYLGVGPVTERDLAQVRSSGASIARLTVSWRTIAPTREPATWTPTDPADENYDWNQLDADVSKLVAAGYEPLLTISGAPRWAQQAPVMGDPAAANEPDAKAFGLFAKAVAERYSGSFEDLPRVRYFQAWNEPNISLYLTPQLEDGKPVAALDYRALLNAFARAVHGVHSNNVAIAGGLAPFRDITPSILSQDDDWGPAAFLRTVLCLSKSLHSTCSTRVDADVWALHPYTSGGPTHHAVLANDVSLGDLPKVKKILAAAGRVGHLRVPHPQLWVTEFSWDSSPPDPQGVPMPLLTRWVAEAVYRLWQNDVRVVTWLQLRDQPLSEGYFQSGLRYAAGRAKPIVQAFRFPFVAFATRSSIAVWGRVPGGRAARVSIQWAPNGAGWKRVTTVSADVNGIFQGNVPSRASGRLRAKVAGTSDASAAFSLTVPLDHFYNPFGQPTPLEPKKPKH